MGLELWPLNKKVRRYRIDEAAGQRRLGNARHRLDVNDVDSSEPANDSEGDRNACTGGHDRAGSFTSHKLRREPQVSHGVDDIPVCWVIGPGYALAGEQRFSIAALKGDPAPFVELPQTGKLTQLEQVATARSNQQNSWSDGFVPLP